MDVSCGIGVSLGVPFLVASDMPIWRKVARGGDGMVK